MTVSGGTLDSDGLEKAPEPGHTQIDRPFPSRRELREREVAVSRRSASRRMSDSGQVQPRQQASARRRGWKPSRSLFQKVVTLSAMFGVAALLVATSLPANALHGGEAAAAATSDAGGVRQSTQSLAVDKKVVDSAPTRDAYTVVAVVEQVHFVPTNGSFLYTNDPNGTIQWPFPVAVPISSGFGARHVAGCSFCSTFHEGVDFTPGTGTAIGVIADGVVSEASTAGPYGNHVLVDHVINGQKVQSLYAHMLAGSIRVAVGQAVTVGQELGQVGSTGEATGPHLHLEVHLDGTPVDPFAWLKANAN
ncbi:MAG TPA: M23 family metallopeptidase [Lacisediminihabitans sp.]|uniref:M23 family metallopeptidase n=1 Tax=Lacisediminihabitans sp. TaxID=2787631 RepID=UPI002ED8272E